MTDSDADAIEDLPPSAKLVFKVLEYNGPMTQKGIVQESMLSARTVRYALERLEAIDVVSEDVYFADARQNLYEIIPENTEHVEEAAPGDGADAAACDD
jgi:predicted transcriptional regulator